MTTLFKLPERVSHKATATIDVAADVATAKLDKFAQALGLAVDHSPKGVLINFQSGSVHLSEDVAKTRMEIVAQTGAGLQLLCDTIAQRLDVLELPVDWDRQANNRQPGNMSIATVVGVHQISPSYKRVVLEGPDLARFTDGGLHFRLLFGPEGAPWPYTDETGVTQWPEGISAWHRPVYTARSIECGENGAAQIVFDVFIHEGGRVTEWTRTLNLGATIALTGPAGRRGFQDATWQYMIGDETAVPVVARMLAALPPHVQGKAVLFASHRDDVQHLEHPDGLAVQWIFRSEGKSPLGVLQDMKIQETDRYVFFASERSEAIAARGFLGDCGFLKEEFHAAAYWAGEPVT
jgi:NADPH-dependent ferric siderophore reductase